MKNIYSKVTMDKHELLSSSDFSDDYSYLDNLH